MTSTPISELRGYSSDSEAPYSCNKPLPLKEKKFTQIPQNNLCLFEISQTIKDFKNNLEIMEVLLEKFKSHTTMVLSSLTFLEEKSKK